MLSGDVPVYQRELCDDKGNKEVIAYNDYMKQIIDEYLIVCYVGGYVKGGKEDALRKKFKKVLRSDDDGCYDKRKYFEYFANETYANIINEQREMYEYKEIEHFVNTKLNNAMSIIEFTSRKDIFDDINIEQKGIISINTSHPFILLPIHSIILYQTLEKMLFLSTIPLPQSSPHVQSLISSLHSLLITCHSVLTSQYMPRIQSENYQQTLQILFGLPPKPKPIQSTMSLFKHLFSSHMNLVVYIATWNTNNIALDESQMKSIPFDKWLLPSRESCIPDIYCICIQEAIHLSAYNVVKGRTKETNDKISKWEKIITGTITRDGRVDYVKVRLLQLVGIVMLVFYKKDKEKYVKGFRYKIIKLGLGGATGNKGGCFVSMDIMSTSIAFGGVHLAAGDQKKEQRVQEMKQVLNTVINNQGEMSDASEGAGNSIWDDGVEDDNMECSKESGKRKKVLKKYNTDMGMIHKGKISKLNESFLHIRKLNKHDIWFICGDVNSRTDESQHNVSKLIEMNNVSALLEYDQLNKYKSVLDEFKEVNEAAISFLPTYKFINGTKEYFYHDAKQTKQRVPSYCDRILFQKNNNIKAIEYGSLREGFESSDHRPVFGIYEITIMEEIPNLKNQVYDKIKKNADLNISSQYLRDKYKYIIH